MNQIPHPRRGRLIALAGIDGAGKSTLAKALCAALNDSGHDTILVGKHTVDVPSDGQQSAYLAAVNAVVYRRAPATGRACSDRYWLFALAAWYDLLDQLVVRPALLAGRNVVLDNSHHKILARYTVNPEVATDLAQQVFADLTPADLVLYLRLTPGEALGRKRDFTALEAGRPDPSEEHFLTYQGTVADELAHLHNQDAWVSLDVSEQGPDAVLRRALAAVQEHGLLGVAGHRG